MMWCARREKHNRSLWISFIKKKNGNAKEGTGGKIS